MNKYPPKDLIVFFTALVVIAATFAYGVQYSRSTTNKNSSTLLANIASTIPAGNKSLTLIPSSTSDIVAMASSTAFGKGLPTMVSTPTVIKAMSTNTVTTTATSGTTTIISNKKTVASTTSSSTESASQPTPSVATEILPYSIGIFTNNGFGQGDNWINWWGGTSEANGIITIEATASSTGGGVLLKGSGAWSDYTFQTSLDWLRGETFSLIARYVDDKNYLECVFDERTIGNVHIRLKQHLNGNVLDLADGHIIDYYQTGGANITATMQAQENQGACAFNNFYISTQVTGNVLNPPLHGEIGITAWDPTENNSEIVVKSVSVANVVLDMGVNINSRS